MPDRLTGMQVFHKVAALASFSAAGRALGMSQTMVTKHVQALEKHLGARLFQRTTRRLTLTEAGSRYRASAERILAEIEEAEREGIRLLKAAAVFDDQAALDGLLDRALSGR